MAVFGTFLLGLAALSQFGAPQEQGVKFSTLDTGILSKAKEAKQFVFTREEAFAQYWTQVLNRDRQDVPTNIDWVTQSIIAVHLGTRRTGGYDVQVESVKRIPGGDVRIYWSEGTPQPGTMRNMMVTSPWILLKVNSTTGNFKFQKVSRLPVDGTGSAGACNCACGCAITGRCTCGEKS